MTLRAQPLDISPPAWAWRSAGRGLLSLGKMGGISWRYHRWVMDKNGFIGLVTSDSNKTPGGKTAAQSRSDWGFTIQYIEILRVVGFMIWERD